MPGLASKRTRTMTRNLAASAAMTLLAIPAAAEPIDSLYQVLAEEIIAGKPVVVSIRVALADNQHQGIAPVPEALGRGDDPERNLYWGARYGLLTHLKRSKRFKLIHHDRLAPPGPHGLLEVAVFERRVKPNAAWRRHGVKAPFSVYLVGLAHQGQQFRAAAGQLVRDVWGIGEPLEVRLKDGAILQAGTGARIVGYMGHNAYLEPAPPDPDFFSGLSGPVKGRRAGFFLFGCMTRALFADKLRKPAVFELASTRTLIAPEAYLAEALVDGLAEAEGAETLRRRVVNAYAKYQKIRTVAAGAVFAPPPVRAPSCPRVIADRP